MQDLKTYLTCLSQDEVIGIIGYHQHDKDIENAIKETKSCQISYLIMLLFFQIILFKGGGKICRQTK